MPSFPKTFKKIRIFGKSNFDYGPFDILPDYDMENIMRRLMELSKMNIPSFIFKNSSRFLYLSNLREKDIIHEKNVRKAAQLQAGLNGKGGHPKRR